MNGALAYGKFGILAMEPKISFSGLRIIIYRR